MQLSTNETCVRGASLVLHIAAFTLLTGCSLIVDDELNGHPKQSYSGNVCGYYCPATGSYATQSYPGGPCECPATGTGGVPAWGDGGMVETTAPGAQCWPSMLMPGSVGTCSCVDGSPGSQACDLRGALSPCVCPSAPVLDNDAGADTNMSADNDAGAAF